MGILFSKERSRKEPEQKYRPSNYEIGYPSYQSIQQRPNTYSSNSTGTRFTSSPRVPAHLAEPVRTGSRPVTPVTRPAASGKRPANASSRESRYYPAGSNLPSTPSSRVTPATNHIQRPKPAAEQKLGHFLKFCQAQPLSTQNTLSYGGAQESQYLSAYCAAFNSAIKLEMKEEEEAIHSRINTWTKEDLEESGLALFGLSASHHTYLGNESVFKLSLQGGGDLPFHKFTARARVLLTQKGSSKSESPLRGTVKDVCDEYLNIAVSFNVSIDTIQILCQKVDGWRLDLGGNTTTPHDRCIAALNSVKITVSAENMSAFQRVIIGVPSRSKSLQEVASQPPAWLDSGSAKQKLREALNQAQSSSRLNTSQARAIKEALQRTMTLIQGPPGTGKTKTLCCYVSTALQILAPGSQILVMASSNTAVDNIVVGLMKLNVDVVRIGQDSKISKAIREVTLDARAARDVLGQSAADLRKQALELEGKAKRDVLQRAKKLENQARSSVLMHVPVVACTCISAGDIRLEGKKFSIAVLDEATQTTEPQSLIGFLHNVESAVLVGDGQQLPPTVKSKNAVALGLNVSLFERLQALKLEPLLLNTQYRMHPSIAEFSSSAFYDGKLVSGIGAADRPAVKGVAWVKQQKPVMYINEKGREQYHQSGPARSYRNEDQAKLVLQLVLGIVNAHNSVTSDDIGIITPYAAQVQYIEKMLSRQHNALKGIKVASVDGFQGSEKEVIIFSTVRSNKERAVGFLSDHRRLNVALTRAKRGLIVIGNKHTLSRDPTWRSWLAWVRENGLESRKVLDSRDHNMNRHAARGSARQ